MKTIGINVRNKHIRPLFRISWFVKVQSNGLCGVKSVHYPSLGLRLLKPPLVFQGECDEASEKELGLSHGTKWLVAIKLAGDNRGSQQ